MKTKPIPRNTLPKKSITRNAKMAKQKFEFEYINILGFLHTMTIIISLFIFFSLIINFAENYFEVRSFWWSNALLLTFICFYILGHMLSIKSKSFGYAILHETYVELQLDKVLHIIKYQEISSVCMRGSKNGVLVIASKNNPDVKIGVYSFIIKSSKRYKNSYLPIHKFQKALEAKLKEIDQN